MEDKFYPSEVCKQYVQFLQEDIYQMRENSAKCKAFVISIATAFVAVIAYIQANPCLLIIPIVLVVMGWLLDGSFRVREEEFVKCQSDYIQTLERNSNNWKVGLFVFKRNMEIKERAKYFFKFKVFGFYLFAEIILGVCYCLLTLNQVEVQQCCCGCC